jgi:hypothetical protein
MRTPESSFFQRFKNFLDPGFHQRGDDKKAIFSHPQGAKGGFFGSRVSPDHEDYLGKASSTAFSPPAEEGVPRQI